MKFAPLFLLSLFCLFVPSLSAQEICDNGIDDDADGLIDLNDSLDCNCSLPALLPSLLPNPSFEEYTKGPDCDSNFPGGQPDRPDQVDCLDGWVGGSNRAPSPWNLLTYNSDDPYYPIGLPQPIPDGVGVGGFTAGHAKPGFIPPPVYQSYYGACLPNGALDVLENHRLSFEVGFGTPYMVSDIISHSPSPLIIGIYGSVDCVNLPFAGPGCPGGAASAVWDLIGEVTVSGSEPSWQSVTFDFLPDAPYRAIVIGASCNNNITSGSFELFNEFYFLDKMILNTVDVLENTAFVDGIRVTGDEICAADANMEVNNYLNASYQWYRNGVAIPGATSTNYYPPLGAAFAGSYSCRITRPEGCGLAGPVEFVTEYVTDNFQDSIYFCPFSDNFILPRQQFSQANYLWEDGSREEFLLAPSAGTYSVTITSFCVENVETIVVTDASEPTFSVEVFPEDYCAGDSVQVLLTSNWQLDGGLVVDGVFPATPLGDTIWVIAGEEGNLVTVETYGDACLDNNFETLELVQEPLEYILLFGVFNCGQGGVEVSSLGLPGSPADYLWQWSDSLGNVLSTDTVFFATFPGNFDVELTPLGDGCVDSRTFNIPFFAIGNLIAGAEVPILGCTTQSAELSVNLALPEETNTIWRFNGNIIATMTDVINVNQGGIYQVHAFTLSEDGDTVCTQLADYEVIVDNSDFIPEVQLQLEDPCVAIYTASINDEFSLNGWQQEWFDLSDGTMVAIGVDSVTGLLPGEYRVELNRPDLECIGAATFTVSDLDPLLLTSNILPYSCPDDTTANTATIVAAGFNGTSPYTFQLTGPIDTTSQAGIFDQLTNGTYLISLRDANGCVAEQVDTQVINIPILPSVEAGLDQTINLGESSRLNLSLSSNVPGQINWFPAESLSCSDCPNPQARPFVSTTYQAIFVNEAGCSVSDSVSISVIPTGNVYIPTAFSPNFDGVNDLFTFFPDASFGNVIDFRVYDRWGREVYVADANSPGPIGWDGNTPDGKNNSSGVYTYFIRLQLLNGQEKQFSGSVSLLR